MPANNPIFPLVDTASKRSDLPQSGPKTRDNPRNLRCNDSSTLPKAAPVPSARAPIPAWNPSAPTRPDDFEKQALHGTPLIRTDGKILWSDISADPSWISTFSSRNQSG